MVLFLVHYSRCLWCHVCITYINVCTEDVISKDVACNSHRFVEDIQNFFFDTVSSVSSHCTTSFKRPQHETMQYINFSLQLDLLLTISPESIYLSFWTVLALPFHVSYSFQLLSWSMSLKSSLTEGSAVTFEMQRALQEVWTASRHCDVFFITKNPVLTKW